VVFLLIAAVIHTPLGWGKGLFMVFFLLVTGAVTAHALASAAYHLGLPMKGEMEGDRGVDPAGPEERGAADPRPYNRKP
ncbi:MAG: monovalent cation/H(+) antiporter subunit G, partial [Desulfococcus multivorans]|jgi:multisubunit Na+/H+ antiporter MnhG subunit|nr:monovalent cation/H(+) antiporter subunit G [Desulfococcus multivorans]